MLHLINTELYNVPRQISACFVYLYAMRLSKRDNAFNVGNDFLNIASQIDSLFSLEYLKENIFIFFILQIRLLILTIYFVFH